MHEMMIDQTAERLQSAVARARQLGAAAAKVNYQQYDLLDCIFEAGRLKSLDARQSCSYSIEVVAGGKRGTATGNDLDALETMVARAVALAKLGSAAHFDAYPAPAPLQPVALYDESTTRIPVEEMLANGQQMIDMLLAYDATLHTQATLRRGAAQRMLATSGGVCHGQQQSFWTMGVMVHRTREDDILILGDGRGWGVRNALYNPQAIAEKVLTDLRRAETLVDAPTGRLPVFVEPEGLQMFLWPILMGINGRNVFKGDSPLRGRLGEQVLHPSLTLVDNPHVDYGWGSAAIDGDGVPTRVNTLFRDGVLEMFLYDLDTAGMAGVEPTGNNGCSPNHLAVAPGQRSCHNLLAGIEDGIYIKELVGFGQSNIINGDFSSNVGLGYRIKDGQVVGRVKNVMAAGNLYDILKQPVELSAELDPMYDLPYAVLEGINFSA